MSPSSKSIFGVESNLLIGKNVYDFIHEDDKERVIKQFHSLSENKRIQVPPYRFKTYNNKWIWLETNASNMLDDHAINGIFLHELCWRFLYSQLNKFQLRVNLQDYLQLLVY